jgi:tetratricopeptide (TPR) repeat protein
MGIKETVKNLLLEAEIYKKQGLLKEAAQKFAAARKVIAEDPRIKNREKLLEGLGKMIEQLEAHSEKILAGSGKPELSEKAQDLIKKLFSFSKEDSEEEAIMEGAMALAKFGQFERALADFEKLLEMDSHRVIAAKNILRCHIELDSEQKAADIYEEWARGSLFPGNQLVKVRTFLSEILKSNGVERELSRVEAATEPEEPPQEEEYIDISSVGIYFNDGPSKGKVVELGNLLSIIVAKKDAGMIAHLREGMELKDLQFFSPIAIFNGTGEVAAKSQIKTGPKQGDYCLDIRITGT